MYLYLNLSISGTHNNDIVTKDLLLKFIADIQRIASPLVTIEVEVTAWLPACLSVYQTSHNIGLVSFSLHHLLLISVQSRISIDT